MSHPLGGTDFFALEAGECLNRLESLLRTPGGPPGPELVRVARTFRGAALLAQQQAIAEAGAALEAVAKSLRDGRRAWEPATEEQMGQALDAFRHLVRRSREWTEGDTARATQLAAALDALAGAGGMTPRGRRGAEAELNSGVRAFVAREGALIASALDRAARALQATPGARDPLYAVLRRMQSLRGLAELAELSPLPEILDGVELAVGDLTRIYAPPPRVHDVLDAAAQALTRVCRDVADSGRPTRDSDEARRFTDLLLRAFAAESDVVPIESLYADRDPEPMRRTSLTVPTPAPISLGPLELVSQGEHLVQTADLIESASSATERDLRLYGLAAALRPFTRPTGAVLADALAAFAQAAREAIGGGSAARRVGAFAAELREGGAILRAAADGTAATPSAERLAALAARIAGASSAPAAAPAHEVAEVTRAAPAEPVAIESLAFDGETVFGDGRPLVPIESLAPAAASAAAEPAGEPSAFESSFARYHALLSESSDQPASLDALLGRAPARGAAAPTPVMAPAADVVEIAALCYRGRGALRRAAEVRGALTEALGRGVDVTAMRPLLDELLDLVPLALDDA